ncbi:hypothetical protein ACFXB3_00260 [Streptomyces sp. NPDC059447]|uniref:hypothetical protein n=1 Tax=Streptomyces sp. NPDC059447 TaxID=3346834 RepID=UPI0036AA905D
MTSESNDSPATLYGPVSLFFGVVGLVAMVFPLGLFVVVAASFAITFALLGLGHGFNRVQCMLGLITGCVGLVLPITFLTGFGG